MIRLDLPNLVLAEEAPDFLASFLNFHSPKCLLFLTNFRPAMGTVFHTASHLSKIHHWRRRRSHGVKAIRRRGTRRSVSIPHLFFPQSGSYPHIHFCLLLFTKRVHLFESAFHRLNCFNAPCEYLFLQPRSCWNRRKTLIEY